MAMGHHVEMLENGCILSSDIPDQKEPVSGEISGRNWSRS